MCHICPDSPDGASCSHINHLKATMTTQQRSDREAQEFLANNPDVVTIDMLIPDMNGILRGKQLTRDYLPKLFTEGVRMPGSNYLLDWTGQNIETLDYGTADGDPDFCVFRCRARWRASTGRCGHRHR
jgi:hypothetical protein